MKKITKIFFAGLLTVGFGFAAQAQEANGQGSNTITTSANVLGLIEVTNEENLNFGQVMPGFAKFVPMIIDQNTSVLSSSQGTVNTENVTSGLFHVFAAAGSSIALSFEVEPLKLKEGTDVLALDFNKGLAADGTTTTLGWSTLGTTATVTKLEIDGTNEIDSFPSNQIEGKNGIYVHIGGTVRPTGTQAPGEYEGSLTLTAVYN
ncbi:DUF4402 domain-containing protein [Algoriphagus aquatilis]|uniref:DUF4402 domain-containing protein n=1 Tax=Algoriphagus aquatilis TaxID=490186 RepID=A0ABW0C1J3_9BACT